MLSPSRAMHPIKWIIGTQLLIQLKVLIAVVIGALLLFGLYGLFSDVVIPTTTSKVDSLFKLEGHFDGSSGGGGTGGEDAGHAQGVSFDDGTCTYQYYSMLEKAIEDANSHTTANADADLSNAVAVIAERESDGVYIVKPLTPINVDTTVSMTGEYIFDTNGQTVTVNSGANFLVSNGAKITFRDSGNGNMVKNSESTTMETLITADNTASTLTVLNGNYTVTNTDGMVCAVCTSAPTLKIQNGTFKADSQNKSAYAVAMRNVSGASVEISNGQFSGNSQATTGAGMFVDSTQTNITIHDGVFTGTSDLSIGCGIRLSGSKNITIDKGEFFGISHCTTLSSNSKMGIGIHTQSTTGDIIIKDGTYKGIGTMNSGRALNISKASSNITIYNGKFLAAQERMCSESTAGSAAWLTTTGTIDIKGGVYSGVGQGLQCNSSATTITGGVFESPWHGGIYFGAGTGVTKIKNATLRCTEYKNTEAAKEFGFTKWKTEDGSTYVDEDGIFFSAFYIGNTTADATVYMDSCKIECCDQMRWGVCATVSSSYGYKNSSLYVSNTNFPGKIRVDPENESGNFGSLYIGKGVTHKGLCGSGGADANMGTVDTTTYANQVFCQDI